MFPHEGARLVLADRDEAALDALVPKGVRINAVAPGTINAAAIARMSRDEIEKVIVAHPMGRMGRPVDGGYLAQQGVRPGARAEARPGSDAGAAA